MATDRTIYINNKAYDFGSVVVKIAGDSYEGINSIKYGQKRERGRVFRMNRSRLPLGVTPGKVTFDDMVIKFNKQSALFLRTRLASKAGGTSYGDLIFPISIQLAEPGLLPVTDEFPKCWIAGDDGSADDNTDPLYEEISFGVMSMKRSGLISLPGVKGLTLYAPDRK